jgi:hypothetical protein
VPEQRLEITEQTDTLRIMFDLDAWKVVVLGPIEQKREDELEPLFCPVYDGQGIDHFFEMAMLGHCVYTSGKRLVSECLDTLFWVAVLMEGNGEFTWKRLLHTLPDGKPAEWILEVRRIVRQGGHRRTRTTFTIPLTDERGRYVLNV